MSVAADPRLLRVLLANICPFPTHQRDHGQHARFLDMLANSCRITLFDGTDIKFLSAAQVSVLLLLSQVHVNVEIREAPWGQHEIHLIRREGKTPMSQPWNRIKIVVPEIERGL